MTEPVSSSLPTCRDLIQSIVAAVDARDVYTAHHSDRVAAMAQELAKFGVRVQAEENRVTVLPGGITAPTEELDGHNDHRIVMALSVLAASAGGTISGAEAVNKSYPDFFDALRTLGLTIEIRS